MLTPSEGTEEQALDLVSGKDLVLEKAEQESMVSLIERDHANVSFCSIHDLGTALPPPSVGGLRPNSPVTCGFAPSRPALSRRPCAVGAGTTRLRWTGCALAPRRAAATCRFRRVFSSCRCSPPLPAAQACSGRRRPGPAPAKPSAIAPPHPRAASAGARLPSAVSPPVVLLASFISELASHEVPGFGAPALPSGLGLEALAPAVAIARDHGVSASGWRWRSCLRRHGKLLANQVPRRGHLHPYKGTRGARIVSARKGELMRRFRRAQVRVRVCAT
jgi:hypothetical protein